MEADLGKQEPRIVRYRPSGVTPLELWDLEVDGRILWEFRETPQFPEVLARSLAAIHAGTAATRSGGRLPVAAQQFDAVYLTGGAQPALRPALVNLPFSVMISSDAEFCGERGGLHLLRQVGRCGMVVDVGQTAVKISLDSWRFSFPRDWQALPLRDDDVSYPIEAARSRLRAYLRDSLRSALQATGQSRITVPVVQGQARRLSYVTGFMPEAIVLALPCELNADALPGGSSYIGMAGDADLVRDAIRGADLPQVDVLLLNDAELAALSAACDESFTLPPRTLVMTLGFGVGAALLAREA